MFNQSSHKEIGTVCLESARKLPDDAVCRFKPAGFGNCVMCLVDAPHDCEYAFSFAGISFANEFFCCHPNRNKILKLAS